MKKNKTNRKIMERLNDTIKFIIIYLVIILYISSLYMNYDANKRFDQLFSIEYEQYGYSKGFNFTDEARADPVFFWTWDCSLTKSQQYFICNHCPIFGECHNFSFDFYILSEDEVDIKEALNKDRTHQLMIIIIISIILISFCLIYWIALYKYDHDNWKKTPLARLINRVDKK